MILPVVDYTILYNKKDISSDISRFLISIQYADKVTGESDTLEISVEDHDQRWQNDWYPAKGDSLQLIIRQNGKQLNCGVFEVDELASSSSIAGDVFVTKALAAGVTKKLRTKNSYAHENKSLREIANTVGASMGLTLVGTVPDIRLHICNQYRETNLQFLNRIGSEYGCIFSVRGDSLVFTHYLDLANRNASLTLNRQDLISWDIRDQTHKTFQKAKLKHHDPYEKQTVSYFSKDEEDEGDTPLGEFAKGISGSTSDSADDLELRMKAENPQQAEAKGKHALFKNNTQGVGGDIVLPGNLLFLSGNNLQLNGLGQLSGIYQILEATHSISRSSAYQVAGNIKRVKKIDPSFFKTI